eukprot:COSAG05_NODE_92_length_19835_cov_158.918271_2_plen_191_part_00
MGRERGAPLLYALLLALVFSLTLHLPLQLRRWHSDVFLKRPDMGTCAQRPLDMQRESWCTSKNFELHFDIFKRVTIDAGITYPNSDYDPKSTDPDDSRCQQILYRKDRMKDIASLDEMGVDSDSNPNRRNRSERTHYRKGTGYDGECVASRGQSRFTVVGSLYFDEQPGARHHRGGPVRYVYGTRLSFEG